VIILNAAKVREANDFPVSVFTNYDPDPVRISVCRAGSVHAIFHVVPTEMSISDILQRTVIKKISIPDKKIFIAADSGCLILCQPGIVRVITLRNHGVLFSDKQLRGSIHRDGEGQQELAVQNAKNKAEIIAAAAGKSLGGILLISEGSQGSYTTYDNGPNVAYARTEGAAKDSTTIVRAAQVSVSATVEISYELK